MKWIVPEYDKAITPQYRVASIELVFTDAGYAYQVVPMTNGDVKLSKEIADTMNERSELQAENERLREAIRYAISGINEYHC